MNSLTGEKNRRILIIDDNRAIHDDFRKILSPDTTSVTALDVAETKLFGEPSDAVRKIRYAMDSAYQGQEGVTLLKAALEAGRPYAMAFVDIRMPPGWDGVETTQKLWAVDPEVQIVLCTAYADYSWDEIFEKIGNCDGLLILKKPFDTVEALQLAHALTEKWWLHRQSRRKMEELESLVVERTAELATTNEALKRQQTELRVLFDLIPAMIWFKDTNNRILRVNKRAAETAGKLVEEIEGKPTPEIYPQEAAKFYLDDLEIIESGMAKLGMVEMVRDREGEEHWVQTDKVPYCDQDGKVIGIVVMALDISDRKRAEEALRLLDSAVKQSKESILITDAELDLPGPKILFVNPAFTEMTGYTAAETVGKTPRILQGPLTDKTVLLRLRQNLERGVAFVGEAINYRKDGTQFYLEWQVAPIREATGKITHFVAIQHDITERKAAQRALLDSNEKFQQLVDNITDVFWIRSPDMREVRYLSPGFERIWGRSAASLCANPQAWGDYVLAEDRERVRGAFAGLTGDASGLEIEYRIVRPDGEIRWVRVRGFQVRDQAGTLLSLTGIITDITERKRSEDLIRQSEERYRSLIDNAHDAIFTIGADGTFSSLNPAVETIAGITRADWIGKPFAPMVHPEDLPLAMEMFQRILKGEPAPVHELRGNPELRRPALMEMTLTAQKDGGGKTIGVLGIGRDITDRKRIEARLFESQKLETVGKLAGGIAHEFNSILTAIIGQSELLLGDLPAGSPLAYNVVAISKAAVRAASLTRQLLAYGRKQMLQPETLDLNRILGGLDGTLRHLMAGDAVEIRIVPTVGLRLVNADAGQIEQVIINLALNAQDAMPNGGKLTLETANISFDQDSVGRHPDLVPGDYVMLAISDTGRGMSETVKARAFEPFFTTKDVGLGTGLGLSTCYGIVKQSGGHISVYSEPGRGTAFKIYLPQVEESGKLSLQPLQAPNLPRGTETVLLVEDDPALREMAATLLRRLGYTVLAAANGVEALSLCHERVNGRIHLLFTDVVMPHMSGQELANRMRELYPHTRILFTSAYTETAIVHQGVLDKGVALLQKPFSPSALAQRLREVLDQVPMN